MGKKDYLDYSETSNWNVAKGFAETKILKLLIQADDLELVAQFGTTDLTDEYLVNDKLKTDARVKALTRLLKVLQMTINNTYFALKKQDKTKMDKFRDDLKDLSRLLPACSETSFNQRKNQTSIIIIDKFFNFVFQSLVKIKADILTPLNNADLIFTSDDSMDIDELKKKVMEDMVYSG